MASSRESYQKHKEYRKQTMREYRAAVKVLVFAAYGKICKCCGETEELFLDIDHMDNNGAAHRKELNLTAGTQFYVWLIKNDFPSNFQTLCCNCNRGKFRNNGVCPHKEKAMPHDFEQEHSHHKIHNVSIPRGHGHMDQKLEKGMRSPLMGQLPIDSGIQSQENAPGLSQDDGSL